MIENDTLNEDILRICPLCHSVVRLFFINLDEKMLMCENTKCEFPFGYEELQFVKEDSEIDSDMGVLSFTRNDRGSTSTSIISTAAWAEIDKMNSVCESEERQLSSFSDLLKLKSTNKELERQINNDLEIQRNVEHLKGLTRELNFIEQETSESEVIKNGKWIKNLLNLQGQSGMQLLKQQEIDQLRREEPIFGGGELKIDIDTNRNDISSINIQITNKDDGRVPSQDVT
ncbi:unnamed protein product, partial [Iphiclides podalirius]